MRSAQTEEFTIFRFLGLPEEQVEYDVGHMAKIFMLNTLCLTSITWDVSLLPTTYWRLFDER